MKTIDAAQFMDMIGRVLPTSILAGIAMAEIRFFKCSSAQKRVTNKVVHDCKYSVFPRNPDSPAWLSGKRMPMYRDTKGFSEVC